MIGAKTKRRGGAGVHVLSVFLILLAARAPAGAEEPAPGAAPVVEAPVVAVPPAPPVLDADGLPAIETAAGYAAIMDYESGAILFSKRADEPMKPASMAKMVTAGVVFEKLKRGEITLDTRFTVSSKVWKQFAADPQASKMFVGEGEKIRVEDLIRGILVVSGNDACAVVAENIAGSEEAFAGLMNDYAKRIGMTQSTFANASGMPDPAQNVTPRDLAVLARHLIMDYPEYYHYFAEREFTWNKITQPNRDLLLATYPGADGLKTGHTEESGFGMTASAKRGGRRLIVVVNGLTSIQARAAEAKRLLDIGFQEFAVYTLLKPGDDVGTAQVFAGAQRAVKMTVREPVRLLMRRAARERMRVTLSYEEPVLPPVARGQQLGQLKVQAPGVETLTVPVYAASDVARGDLIVQLKAGFKLLMQSDGGGSVVLDARPGVSSASR